MAYTLVRGPAIALPPRGPRGFDGVITPELEALRDASAASATAAATSASSIAFRTKFLSREYALGDSMTANGTYETQLQSDLGSAFQVVNVGIGGEGTGQIALRYINDVIVPGDAHGVTILAGVNDLIVSDLFGNSFGRTLANVEAGIKSDLQAMYTALKGAGIRVRAVTILPFGTFTEALGGAIGPAYPGSGTIVTSTSSTAVAGTGTHFITEGYKAGMKVKRSDGTVIGTLASDPSSETSMTLTANAAYAVSGVPAYKNVEWTAAKEVIRGNVNSWIMNVATDVDDRIDASTAMRDPAHTERLLPANVSSDKLHPSTDVGYPLLGRTIYLGGTWTAFSVPTPTVEISQPVLRADQGLRRTDDVRFNSQCLGRGSNPAAVRNVRTRSRSYPRAEEPLDWFEQPNANGYGWLVTLGDDGVLMFWYVINGVRALTPTFRLDSAGLNFVSDTRAFRLRTSTYGGGSGAAQDYEPFSVAGTLAGYVETTWKAGGTAFGAKKFNAATYEFQINGSAKFLIGPAGQLNAQYLPVYADNTAAAVDLAVGDLYRTSTGAVFARY